MFCTHIHTLTHTQLHTCARRVTHTHTHARARAHARTHARTRTNTQANDKLYESQKFIQHNVPLPRTQFISGLLTHLPISVSIFTGSLAATMKGVWPQAIFLPVRVSFTLPYDIYSVWLYEAVLLALALCLWSYLVLMFTYYTVCWIHQSDSLENISSKLTLKHPSTIPSSEWIDDMKRWPLVEYKNIFNYLMLSVTERPWRTLRVWNRTSFSTPLK